MYMYMYGKAKSVHVWECTHAYEKTSVKMFRGIYLSKALTCMIFFLYKQK